MTENSVSVSLKHFSSVLSQYSVGRVGSHVVHSCGKPAGSADTFRSPATLLKWYGWDMMESSSTNVMTPGEFRV